MSFLEEAQAQGQKTGPQCSVRKWLDSQSEVSDADLREAAREVSAAAAWRALAARGFTERRHSLERHIRGECACPSS